MKNFEKSFTLVEILVVVAIIGIIAGIILVNLSTSREKAKIAVAKSEARNIYNAILLLSSDTEEWPDHQTPDEINQTGSNELCPDGCTHKLSDCQAGLVCDDGLYSNWDGPYITKIPKDPWGKEYFFDTDYDTGGGNWVAAVGSYGPDGVGNNQYNTDDILYIVPTR